MDVSIETILDAAPDRAFRGRVTSEYRRIRNWVQSTVAFDHASILDFGCGDGAAAASFALRHPRARICGVDIEPVDVNRLQKSLAEQTGQAIPGNLTFATMLDGHIDIEGPFELVYAWSVLQSIPQQRFPNVMSDIRLKMTEQGVFFVQVEPLYFSPTGSLLYRYVDAPWHHLRLSLSELRGCVLTADADDARHKHWHQFMDSNRMTAPDIIDAIEAEGFTCVRRDHFKTDLKPPRPLLQLYDESALTTTGFQAMFKKR